MSNSERNMRTALGRERNHGAAHDGTSNFIAQRATSIALALLAPWFVVAVAFSVRDASYLATIDFLSDPLNAVGVVLLVVIGVYHMSLGMQEVILDYVLKPPAKFILLFLNVAFPLVLAIGAIFAVMLVNFGV